jgi:hypothetical protein
VRPTATSARKRKAPPADARKSGKALTGAGRR